MPVEEVVGSVLGAVLRVVGTIVVDVVLEVIIRGPGYLLCRAFTKQIDAESAWVMGVGVAFWGLVAIIAYTVYRQFS